MRMTADVSVPCERGQEQAPGGVPLSLVALCLGYFMVILDATIVTVALPEMARQLAGTHSTAGPQWISDGYTLPFAALLLSAGAIGDRRGARQVFMLGLALFVLTSAGCGLSPNLGLLIALRVLQGASAALVVPTSLALIRASFTDQAARARAIGVWGGVGGVAAAAGPVLGGVLTTELGWRWVFFVNLPIGALGLLLTATRVVKPAPRRGRGIDLPGQLSGVTALTALVYALIESGHGGWTTRTVLGGLAVFVVAGVLFWWVERRRVDPLLPLGLLRSATLSSTTVVGLLMNAGFYGELFVMAFYFQQFRGWAPLLAGLAMLPQAGVVSIGSLLSGRIVARTGPRLPMMTGLAIGAAGFLGLLVAGPNTSYPLLVAPLAATGFGISVTMPAATTAAVDAVPGHQAGLASGILNASRQVGSALGVAVLGALLGGGTAFVSGVHVGSILAAAMFVIGAVVSAFGIERRRAGAVASQ